MKITDRLHISNLILRLYLLNLRSNQNNPGKLAYGRDRIFKNTSADEDTLFIGPE